MKKENNNHIKITFTGDLMSSFAMNEYCRKGTDNYDYHCLFDNIRNRLYESDYVIANLETTISGKELKFTDSCGSFNTPKQFLEAVKEAGIDFVTTANNHILDRGIIGMVNTLDELDKMGIRHTGSYRKQDIQNEIIDFNGCRIAILSFTYGTNSEMNHCYLDENNEMLVDILRKQPTTFDFQILPPPDKKIQYLIERIKRKWSSIFHIRYQAQIYDTSSINDVDNLENLEYEERAINKIRAAKRDADLVYVCLHCGGQYNQDW